MNYLTSFNLYIFTCAVLTHGINASIISSYFCYCRFSISAQADLLRTKNPSSRSCHLTNSSCLILSQRSSTSNSEPLPIKLFSGGPTFTSFPSFSLHFPVNALPILLHSSFLHSLAIFLFRS